MRHLSIIIFLLIGLFLQAQPSGKRISRVEYISMFKDEAIKEMHRSGVPASITLAQGILESGDGNSPLARKANNHFGIKCHSDWKGSTYIQDDDKKNECFRKYRHVLDSYHDHSEFLKKKRYAFLFDLKPTDYKGWAKGLKKAGYATNPKYPQLLIRIIEENDLAQYDRAPLPNKRKQAQRKVARQETEVKATRSNSTKHRVLKHENNIRYIELQSGDAVAGIAREFNMGEWQLYKYNDLDKDERLNSSGKLYLQPKRNRAKQDYHTVQAGETMWEISQQYGVKLKKLYKKNRMNPKDELKAGQKLYLRKKKPRE